MKTRMAVSKVTVAQRNLVTVIGILVAIIAVNNMMAQTDPGAHTFRVSSVTDRNLTIMTLHGWRLE